MANTINIADMKQMIEDYMVDTISQQHPDIDVSSGSVFRDLFITPLTTVVQPFLERINRMELKLNLDNAEYLTEDELDEIGSGNYFLDRGIGTAATGKIIVGFSQIPESENIVIPESATFSTNEEYQYSTLAAYTFSPIELANNYNTDTQLYEVEISVTAVDVGTVYNVSPGSIVNIDTAFSNYASSVTNTEAIRFGEDSESNVDYATRIKNFYLSRQLGTNEGYKSLIYDGFPEVRDIFVAGKDSEYMVRDMGTFTDIGGTVYEDIHLGGKVDIYLQGFALTTTTVNLTCKSNNMPLANTRYVTSSALVYKAGDVTKTPIAYTETALPDDKTVITVDYSLFVLGDSLTIEYSYTNSSEVIVDATEVFLITTCTTALIPPFDSISSIINSTQGIEYDISTTPEDTYTITTTSEDYEEGTSKEEKVLNFINEGAYNGDEIAITYLYNGTVSDIDSLMNIEDNRIITTDILIKPGNKQYVNIYMAVKTKEGLDYELKLQMIAAVQEYFDSLKLGDTFYESELVTLINNNETIKSKIQYLEVPISSIYVTTDISADVTESTRDAQPMECLMTDYFYLNKIEIVEVG